MSRRGEYIRKRKDNRWEGRYKLCLNEEGKWKYRSVYGKTYGEVKEKLSYAKTRELSFAKKQTPENNFSAILSLWLKSIQVRIKPSTENKYQYMIEKHISPVLGNYKVSDLNTTLINSFLNAKLKNGKLNGTGGLAPAYVQTMSVIIASALHFAAQEEMCHPLKSPIYKPSSVKTNLRILTEEEQKRFKSVLLYNIDETKLGVLIALYTGLRIGEICALSWKDIDFECSVIRVNHTVARVKCDDGSGKTKLIIDAPKTKSSLREIPIPSILFPILKQRALASKSDYVVSTNGTFVSTRTFDYRYRALLRKSEISELNFHSLRHTFATRCVNAGVDVKTLSEILGHSNVSITLNLYVHPSFEMKKAQLEKLCLAV